MYLCWKRPNRPYHPQSPSSRLWLSHRPLIWLYTAHIKNPACRYLLQKRRREWDTREAKRAGTDKDAGKDAGAGTASDGRRPP